MHVRTIGAFAAEPRSPGLVRRELVALLGPDLSGDTLDDVLLAVSELATNAVLHAGTTFEVRVGVAGDRLRVEVADESATPPRPATPAPTDVSGRGLHLVDGIADRWGTEVGTSGKTVWLEMTVVPAAAPAPC